MLTGGEVLQQRSLGVDEDGLFVSGPAIVKIIEDNRPIYRRFDFSLVRVGLLLPQPEMAEDPFDELRLIDEADKVHFMFASGTTERVNFPDFFYELSPGFRRNPPWPMGGHIQHRHLGAHRRVSIARL
jgi:hypothetical protein